MIDAVKYTQIGPLVIHPLGHWHCTKHGTAGKPGECCFPCQEDATPQVAPPVDGSPIPTRDDYTSLRKVLMQALDQAATGKGAQRHGQDLPFTEQPMLTISRTLGTNHGLLYQAAKKAQESTRMDKDAAIRELLGAINYLAGAVIFLETNHGR